MFPSKIEREEIQRKDKKSVNIGWSTFYHNDGMQQRVKKVISNQCDDGSPKIRIRAGFTGSLKRGRSAEEAK